MTDVEQSGADSYRSDAYLDSMREHGDPLADQLIRELQVSGQYESVRVALRSLRDNSAAVDSDLSHLPLSLREYLRSTAQIPEWADPEQLARASAFFQQHGPCILMMLGCYSLPADYAARKGVQVLFRTGELVGSPSRRVLETTQMIVDVLEPGGLQAAGRGLRTLQKVRLVHAAVRAKLLQDPHRPWDPTLGIPINQEDMAGTLLSFSTVVLDGFRKLGAQAPRQTEEAFLHVWQVVGHLTGLRSELIPRDLDDADLLAKRIQQRQHEESEEGKLLTRELIAMMEYNTPGRLFDGLPATLMHHFLGDRIAAMVGIPAPDWTRKLVRWGQALGALHLALDDSSQLCRRLSEWFAQAYVYGLLHTNSDEGRAPFMLPTGLREYWQVPAPAHLRAG